MGFSKGDIEHLKAIYEGTEYKFEWNGIMTEGIQVTQGLKQGCPLSPLLFALYLVMLTSKLENNGRGFDIGGIKIPGLAYADDIVLLADKKEDMVEMLKECSEYADESKLKYNISKSQCLVFGDSLGDVFHLQGQQMELVNEYKYLGVTITNSIDYLDTYKKMLAKKAQVSQGIILNRAFSSIQKYFEVRLWWKGCIVPILTFANEVLVVGDVNTVLEKAQYMAGKIALGGNKLAPKVAVQGEMGWSSFEEREAVSKISYLGRLMFMDEWRYAKIVFTYMKKQKYKSKWDRRSLFLDGKYDEGTDRLRAQSDKQWKKIVGREIKEKGSGLWRQKVESHSTLVNYRYKGEIKWEEQMYDNTLGSALFFGARTGSLVTRGRVCHWLREGVAPSQECRLCGERVETVEHIVTECKGIESQRPERKQNEDSNSWLIRALALDKDNERNQLQETLVKNILLEWRRKVSEIDLLHYSER